MAKQGQHKNDGHDQTKSKGPNNPSHSQTIVTGTYKKQETYRKQAAEHKDPGKQAQAAKNEWNEDTRDKPTIEGSTRARHPRTGRSGSDSNAGASTRGTEMPEETTRSGSHHPEEWRYDLNPAALTGAPTGQSDLQSEKATATAHDVKDVHRHLHGFTDDELKSIPVLPDGSRLQEGATYIDLQDPARREFTATGGMDASPAHYYVPKSEVDYVLWNRLIGVTDPARLDQAQ